MGFEPVMVLRAALWLLALSAEPGQCSWDTLSEGYDGIGGGGGGHGNGRDNCRLFNLEPNCNILMIVLALLSHLGLSHLIIGQKQIRL